MTAGPANRIREIRCQRGLTQSRLAELVNATTQQISYLERGERQLTLHWMTRLAAALGCAPADLFSPAAPPPALGVEERLWLDLFRALSPAERDALLTVGRSMTGGIRRTAAADRAQHIVDFRINNNGISLSALRLKMSASESSTYSTA